ncbi:protein hunchback [Melanaphis sacchari]|uniref:protein hunchback n=1 Tax=Melanaphis sacchari TaxID=742174 RepID=UPI000DC157C8|nr:protein hunchback [Melanaphis sacchari]
MFLENEHQPIISHSQYDLARPLEHHHHHHLNHHVASNHLQSSTDHLQDDSEGRSSASSPTSSYRDLSGCEDFDLKIPKPSGIGSGTGGNNNNNSPNNNNNNNNKEQKPKKHKCKHCGLECTEKVQYWKHIRTHIKPEQLLECPNCEFATDLKHHYEYHLLNHTGAKPFTCPDCDYKCVSKSMLQSHLKSHSNVFQFQCYDCGYASKYMHSLKQHLKKRDHRPATPLNPDGTPNPDIVIDVVGNRRGPRQNKKQNRHNPYQQQPTQQSVTVCSSQDDGGSSSGGHPSPYSMQQLLQMPSSGCAQVSYPTSAESFMYSMITKRSIEMVDYQAAEYMAIKNNNNNNSSSVDDKMDVQQNHHHHHHHQQQQHNHNHHHKRGHQYHPDDVVSSAELAGGSGSGGDRTPEPQAPVLAVADPSPPPTMTIETGPLNLSRDSVAPRAAGSSRRKGIACKLERPAAEPQPKSVPVPVVMVPTPPVVPMDCCSEPRRTVEEVLLPVKEEFYQNYHQHQQQLQTSSSSTPEKDDKEDETHVCHHCDIIFKENIMYSMHMGFHSFRDPFACNLCGEITADKFSFFAHIARVPHS